MVMYIPVDESMWNDACERTDILSNRESFYEAIKTFIAKYITKNTIIHKTTMVTLPSFLSKGNRYTIHKFTTKDFVPASHDSDGERIMSVSCSKEFVEQLFHNYQFNEPVTVPPKTDKQLLFEHMLQFMETNLSNELQEYLNSI
jgi:hypothetical protein